MSLEDQMVLENIDEFVNDEGKIVSCHIFSGYFFWVYNYLNLSRPCRYAGQSGVLCGIVQRNS